MFARDDTEYDTLFPPPYNNIILLITLNNNIKLYYITAKERNTQKDKHVVILDSDK